MESTFIDKLIDWKDFELFVKQLYEQDMQLEVEHDVTLIGKSGAKRQIDVLIKHKTKLHEYVTIVECKRWKEKVDRSRVDILFASIEDLNASKGVIFTTSGYEEGAEKYAQSKNIDLFIVRDLTDEEWGLPGRVVHFFMQTFCSNLKHIEFPQMQMIPIVDEYPSRIDLGIIIEKDQKYDENLYLYSKRNGIRNTHLISLILEKQNEILQQISDQTSLLGDGTNEESLIILSDLEIDFSEYEFKQLRYPYGILLIDKLICKLITSISQKTFHFDRGSTFDLSLTIENYIRRQKHIFSKRKDETNIQVTENLFDKLTKEKIVTGDVLQNNSIFKVMLAPYVNIELDGNEKTATTEKIIIKLKN